MFLRDVPQGGFYGEWIVPTDGFSGHHMYATDGVVAFDYHGYLPRDRFLQRYRAGWNARYPGWNACIEPITFDLLDTTALNKRKHLGPDQFFADPIVRAQDFIAKFDHKPLYAKATAAVNC